MKKVWLVLTMLIPVLALIGPGCKKSQDEKKAKVKAVKQADIRAIEKETPGFWNWRTSEVIDGKSSPALRCTLIPQ